MAYGVVVLGVGQKRGSPKVVAGGSASGGTPAYEALFICGRHYPLWGLGRQAIIVHLCFFALDVPDTC